MAQGIGPDKHIAAARDRLTQLADTASRTGATERAILNVGRERFDTITAELLKLRPKAISDAAAGERFNQLMLERGQIALVIARAQQALAQP